MIWSKHTLKFRNRVAELAMDVDSCAMIEGGRLTSDERETIQRKLREVLRYMDERLGVVKEKK